MSKHQGTPLSILLQLYTKPNQSPLIIDNLNEIDIETQIQYLDPDHCNSSTQRDEIVGEFNNNDLNHNALKRIRFKSMLSAYHQHWQNIRYIHFKRIENWNKRDLSLHVIVYFVKHHHEGKISPKDKETERLTSMYSFLGHLIQFFHKTECDGKQFIHKYVQNTEKRIDIYGYAHNLFNEVCTTFNLDPTLFYMVLQHLVLWMKQCIRRCQTETALFLKNAGFDEVLLIEDENETLNDTCQSLHDLSAKDVCYHIKRWVINIHYKEHLLKIQEIFNNAELSGKRMSVLSTDKAKSIVKNELLSFITEETLNIMFNCYDKWRNLHPGTVASQSAERMACILYYYPLNNLLKRIMNENSDGNRFMYIIGIISEETGWSKEEICRIQYVEYALLQQKPCPISILMRFYTKPYHPLIIENLHEIDINTQIRYLHPDKCGSSTHRIDVVRSINSEDLNQNVSKRLHFKYILRIYHEDVYKIRMKRIENWNEHK